MLEQALYVFLYLLHYCPNLIWIACGLFFYFFHFFKEEDDEVTDEENTSSDDGYPRDKKTCFMCKERFPTFSGLTQHQVLCKNSLKCPKCHCTGADYKLVKNFVCHTKLCNGDGSFRCPHCSKFFMIIIWLEITNTGVKIKEYVMYAILQPAVLKQ